LRLLPVRPEHADLIATWITDEREAFWLAPRTAPPLTPAKIRAWAHPLAEPLVLADAEGDICAYGELNLLDRTRGEFWLGHLIVDPARRGRGLGRALTCGLAERGFALRGARRITLVVFAENQPAIACYRRSGFVDDDHETHYFAPYRTYVRLLRMRAVR
jgi:ribosomal protein S18 acetylase RimI-like enzyme